MTLLASRNAPSAGKLSLPHFHLINLTQVHLIGNTKSSSKIWVVRESEKCHLNIPTSAIWEVSLEESGNGCWTPTEHILQTQDFLTMTCLECELHEGRGLSVFSAVSLESRIYRVVINKHKQVDTHQNECFLRSSLSEHQKYNHSSKRSKLLWQCLAARLHSLNLDELYDCFDQWVQVMLHQLPGWP